MMMPSFFSLLLALTPSALAGGVLRPPATAKKPTVLEKHGYKRLDNYFWLRERESPEVLRHLREENAYSEGVMSGTKALQKQLFEEIKGRMVKKDVSAPVLDGGFLYYHRIDDGMQYHVYARRKGSMSAPEEVLIDGNELAKGKGSFHGTRPMMSPNHAILAYGVNFTGDRIFEIRFKDLAKNQLLPARIQNASGEVAWAADNETLFYVELDKALRSYRVHRFNVRTGKDEVVFTEADERFNVSVSEARTGNLIVLHSGSTLTDEVHLIDTRRPLEPMRVVAPREQGIEYSVSDGGDRLFIRTNWNATNFRLMEAPLAEPGRGNWKEVLPHDPASALESAMALRHHIVTENMRDGLREIVVYDRATMTASKIRFPESAFDASLSSGNVSFDPPAVRYDYQSMKTPPSELDYDLATGQSRVVKVQDVPGYKAERYSSGRVWITARDGAKVPVTLLHRADVKADGKAPLFVYGYGAYGMSMTPYFGNSVFSLVDRGFVYAIIHVRGGSELGRSWYDNGRGKHKMNSFRDFIDGTEALLKMGYGDRTRAYASGGSAGGLLVGAVMNMRPDLYRGVVADVPFVDVLSTMLDDTLPLTVGEYEQWGNPNVKEDYETMAEYSPIDNIRDAAYPFVLATGGLHDSQVPYWEPAKLVAKMRDHNKAKTFQIFKVNLDSGHGGASGRYDAVHEAAFEKAFVLMIDKPAAAKAKRKLSR